MRYINLFVISLLLFKENSVISLNHVTTRQPLLQLNDSSYIDKDWGPLIKRNLTSFMKLYLHGSKKYFMNSYLKATYFEASQFCQDINMHLVSVENAEDNKALLKYIRDTNQADRFWSSGTRLVDGHNWIWMSTFEATEYTNWGEGEPNGSQEYCIELNHIKNVGLFWNDRDCNEKLNIICEKDFRRDYADNDIKKKKQSGKIFADEYVSPNIALLHFEDKSYFIGRYYRGTYLQAVQFCKMIRMQLATIESTNENNRLYKYIRDTSAGEKFWSSGTKLVDGKTWIWISNAKPVEYTNWALNKPDNPNYYCILLLHQKNRGLFWHDYDCNDRCYYICEKSNRYN